MHSDSEENVFGIPCPGMDWSKDRTLVIRLMDGTFNGQKAVEITTRYPSKDYKIIIPLDFLKKVFDRFSL